MQIEKWHSIKVYVITKTLFSVAALRDAMNWAKKNCEIQITFQFL